MRELWFEQNDLLHLRQWCRLLNVPNREWHRVHISDSWNPSSNLAAALPPKPPPPTAPRRTSPHHAHSALGHTTHK